MATLLQQRTVTDRVTDWWQQVTFSQFDPTLGILQGFGFGLDVTIASGIFFESLEAAPSSVMASVDGRADLYGPTGNWLASTATLASGSADLAADDGVSDQAGASGATLRLADSGASVASYGAGVGTAGSFVGSGTVDLTVAESARLHLNGPANFEVSAYTTGSATVSLEYQYDLASAGNSYTATSGSEFSSSGAVISLVYTPFLSPAFTTAPQTFSFADRTTGWHDHASVARFDPAFGHLQSVNLTLSADIVAGIGVQNDLTVPASIATTQTSTVALGSLLSVAPTVSDNMWLAAGEIRSDQGLTQTAATSATLTDPAGLAAFTGHGAFDLPVSSIGTASLDGPGTMYARLLAESGATVSVSYTYVPAPASWTAGAGGQWSGAGNWAVASVPAAADDVSITLGGNYTVTLDTDQTVHSLLLDAPGATLVLGANLHAIGDITVNAGRLVFAGGSLWANQIAISSNATIGTDTGDITLLPATEVVTAGGSPGGSSSIALHDLLPPPRLGGGGSLGLLEAAPLVPPRGATEHLPAAAADGADFWDLGWR